MLGRWTWTLALGCVVALGCDGDRGGTDAGGQDSGGNRTDSGPNDSGTPGTDSGTPGEDGGGAGCGSLTLPALSFEEVAPGAWGSRFPLGLAQPPGSSDLYVVDQRGEIVIVRGGSALPAPFLNLRSTVDFGGRDSERGLLGLAFHPDYETNGRFFVYYTSTEAGRMRNVVAEYHYTSGDVADGGEVQRLVDLRDPEFNHNGGMLAFGPDGLLYVGIGDGGGGGDRHGATGNGLNLDVLFGKILRLDVDNSAGAFAAADNPFGPGTTPSGLPQIWAYGLRNPWRFSFDRVTGDFWIGDVGQNAWEEIDFQPASSVGGENYGWAAYEGTREFRAELLSLATSHTPPVLEYDHFGSEGVISGFAVVGGYVYRGDAIPGLRGWYLFGDYVNTPVAAFRYCEGAVAGVQQIPALTGALGLLTSFGEDNAGELYMLGDRVVRIIPN